MPVKHLKKHILPHPQHKRRATLLRNRAVFVYSLGILTIFSFFRGVHGVLPGVLGYASNIYVSDLLKYTNDRREVAGVGSLTVDPKLTKAAQKKAEHMFKNNYWAHVAPDGTDPWSFIVGVDYDYLYAGENLAKNFSNSKDVVEAWYKSPSHRENLINGKYTDVGYAVVNGVLDGYETTLVVQMFGKPRYAPAQVAVKGTENNYAVRPLEQGNINPTEAVPSAMEPTSQHLEQSPNEPSQPGQTGLQSQPIYTPTPKIDVYLATKIVALSFSCFMFALFTLDIWYSKKHAILKLTGHTFAHMAFLIFAVAVIYFSLEPGRLI